MKTVLNRGGLGVERMEGMEGERGECPESFVAVSYLEFLNGIVYPDWSTVSAPIINLCSRLYI